MNASAWRSRRRTQINSAQRRSIRSRTENRSRDELPQIRGAAVNVATREIRIRFFQIGRAHFVARQNAIAEVGSEPLDLRFDFVGDVDLRGEWHVRIGPKRVLTARGARFVKKTLLCGQNKWTPGNFSVRDIALRGRDFFERPAEMNRPGATTCVRFPRNGRRQRVIDFKNSRRVPEIFQSLAITRRQLRAGDPSKLPNCCIEKSDARFRKLIQIADPPVDLDLAAELEKIIGEGVGDGLRSTARNGPEPPGLTSVPSTIVASSGQVTAVLSSSER